MFTLLDILLNQIQLVAFQICKKKYIHVHDMIRLKRTQVEVGQFGDKPKEILYIL